MCWRTLVRELAFATVIVICFYNYWQLLGGYFDHIYEPDTDFKLIDVFINLFTFTDVKSIPNPIVDRDLAYFDTGPMLYALLPLPCASF